MSNHPPLWGNFVGYADEDMLAFGLLASVDMLPHAFYHGTQAIEKYLKALCLAIIDPTGVVATPATEQWIRKDGHDLIALARRCGQQYPYYVEPDTLNQLRRFAEFDQLARYPWVSQRHGNGFTSSDFPIFGEITCHLRNDLPIIIDNYKLGMEVRGHFHNAMNSPDPTWHLYSHQAIVALKKMIPNIESFVRV